MALHLRPQAPMSRWLVRITVALGVVAALLVIFVLMSGRTPAAPAATPKPTPGLDQALLARRVTFLVVGTDQNAQRNANGEPQLTDTMIVVSINAAHTKMAMISVPRDSVGIPLEGGGAWPSKLNALYSQKGIDALRGAMDTLLGTKIDFTILINMDDFARVVDAFGGIDLTVPETIVDPSIGLRITAGKHHLDGRTALLYCRSRHTTNDFERAARQQEVLRALLARFVAPNVAIDVPKLVASLGSIQTDIGTDKLPTIAELARRSKAAAVTHDVLTPPRFYEVGSDPSLGYVLVPKLAAIRAFAKPLLTGP
jgi:polyisoprenyl-teichoic acid--peptidoglycan teichoic acid transferase